MSKNTFICPAFHQESLPYHGDVRSWCDQCGAMVKFTRMPAEKLAASERRQIETHIEDRCRKIMRRPVQNYQNRRPYSDR